MRPSIPQASREPSANRTTEIAPKSAALLGVPRRAVFSGARGREFESPRSDQHLAQIRAATTTKPTTFRKWSGAPARAAWPANTLRSAGVGAANSIIKKRSGHRPWWVAPVIVCCCVV